MTPVQFLVAYTLACGALSGLTGDAFYGTVALCVVAVALAGKAVQVRADAQLLELQKQILLAATQKELDALKELDARWDAATRRHEALTNAIARRACDLCHVEGEFLRLIPLADDYAVCCPACAGVLV